MALASVMGAGLMVCAPARAETCDSLITAFELTKRAEVVERSWLEMSVGGAREAAADLVAGLPCVDGALTPQQAARVHRAIGLAQIVDRDLDGAAMSFAAARYADPGLGVSEALAPTGTPVRELFVRPLPYVPAVDLTRPRGGTLVIDGTASAQRPGARPIVLQHVDSAGSVVGTWLVGPGAPLPEAPWADPHRGLRRGLRIGAAGAGVTALALLGAAAAAEGKHQDPTQLGLTVSDLDGLRGRSHSLTIASGVVGAVAAGTLGFSFAGVLR